MDPYEIFSNFEKKKQFVTERPYNFCSIRQPSTKHPSINFLFSTERNFNNSAEFYSALLFNVYLIFHWVHSNYTAAKYHFRFQKIVQK